MTPAMRERYWPMLLAVLVMGCSFYAVQQLEIRKVPVIFPGACLTLGIVVASFTATQKSMLLTMGGSKLVRYAVTTGFYKDIVAYLREALASGLLVAILAVPALLVDDKAIIWNVWVPLQLGAFTLIVGLIARNEWLVNRIIMRYWEERSSEK